MAVYTAPEYITIQDLERRFGRTVLAQFCDDDGDGEADGAVLIELIQEASGAADATLFAAFGADVVQNVVQDIRAKGAIADIAMSLAGRRRPEFVRSDGTWPYSYLRKPAEKLMMDVGKGAERLGSEATQGNNPTLPGRTGRDIPATHVFAPSRTNPTGRGGF